jgi:hypothetical protein
LVACHRRHPRATTASGACASLLDSRWFCCPSSRGVLLPCAHTRLHSPSCTFNNPPPPPAYNSRTPRRTPPPPHPPPACPPACAPCARRSRPPTPPPPSPGREPEG